MSTPDPSEKATFVARIEALEELLDQAIRDLAESQTELTRKGEIIASLEKRLFGSQSERHDPDQDQLQFKEGELLLGKLAPSVGEDESEEPETDSDDQESPKKKRTRRKKADLYPKNLMVQVVQTLVPDEVAENPDDYIEIDELWSDELECVQAQLYWKRTVRKKFVPKDDRTSPPIIAPAPEPTLPGTKIGSALAAQITVDKYRDHLPLYRQSGRFDRKHKATIGRSTLNSWVMATAGHLALIAQAIQDLIVVAKVLQVDETPMKYLRPGTGKCGTGYLWVYYDPVSNTVVYDWQLRRSADCLEKMLANFAGYIQCDGYSAYLSYAKKHGGIILAACLAHIRRKFFDAKEGAPVALEILLLIQKLYAIERDLREHRTHLPCRALIRRARAGPVVKELLELILKERKDGRHYPKSKMGEALTYALGQWNQFERYLEEGCLEIDNNLVENAVRPTKLGLKNYLFFGSAAAGEPNAVLYTLIENAVRQGLDPESYLEEVIRRLPENPSLEEAAELTPAKIAAERAAREKMEAEEIAA